MPHKGYKQSEEHKTKKAKFLVNFSKGYDSRTLRGKKSTPEERKNRLTRNGYKYLLRKKYGITIEEYEQMFKKQDGRCAICGIYASSLKRWMSVDHNHETGKVRGLLCNLCNTAIGSLKDNIQFLENAIQYLKNN